MIGTTFGAGNDMVYRYEPGMLGVADLAIEGTSAQRAIGAITSDEVCDEDAA